ncbi:WD repeat domain-containing protein [Xylariomycetidae sp. FL0641]|nr:WD repeat domain-containing protein [Xylariomycetidae sp. FL0641]
MAIGGAQKAILTPRMGSLSQELVISDATEDTISSVSWSPVANHLAAGSWDGKVRIYDIANNGSAPVVAALSAGGPVLDCDWAKDGSMVAAGGADKKVHVLDAASGQQVVLGSHEAPIKGVRFVAIPQANGPILVSGAWDKLIKYWDLRMQSSIASLECKDRVYSIDSKQQLLVVATAAQHLHLVDLRNPAVFSQSYASPLPCQSTSVTALPDGQGFGLASIEGRSAIHGIPENSTDNFSFRCHRSLPDKKRITRIYAVHAVSFHPSPDSHVFATAGGDGTFVFWNRKQHSRLVTYAPGGAAPLLPASSASPFSAAASNSNKTAAEEEHPTAITAAAFSNDAKFFAYALGYDWSRGAQGNAPQAKNTLALHPIIETDLVRKD